MARITYETKFRKKVVEFAMRHENNSEAARKYGVSRQRIGIWRQRYDGTMESLMPQSTRPHQNPNATTEEEIALIMRIWRRHKRKGLDYVYGILIRKKKLKRDRSTVYNILRREGEFQKTKKPLKKRKNKEYHAAVIPGQKLQMDVKYVPKECMPERLRKGGLRWYQWTIIDEATSLRFTQFFDDKANMNSVKFVGAAKNFFPFRLQEIQTDNGTEFTNKFLATKKLSSFEKYVRFAKIKHKLIRPGTPRHNGRVERSHRTDDKRFYEINKFSSIDDLRKKGEAWLKQYNNDYLRKFGYLSPMEIYGIWERFRQPLTKQFIALFDPRQGQCRVA